MRFDQTRLKASQAKLIGQAFGDDMCKIVVENEQNPQSLVLCTTGDSKGKLQKLKSILDNNFAHSMKDQDFIVLPYLQDKVRIPVLYLH